MCVSQHILRIIKKADERDAAMLQGGHIGVIGAYVGFCDHYNVSIPVLVHSSFFATCMSHG